MKYKWDINMGCLTLSNYKQQCDSSCLKMGSLKSCSFKREHGARPVDFGIANFQTKPFEKTEQFPNSKSGLVQRIGNFVMIFDILHFLYLLYFAVLWLYWDWNGFTGNKPFMRIPRMGL